MIPPRLLAAVITPFDDSGEIDEQAHRHNVRVLRDRGLRGLVVAGSTGEGPYLERGERNHLVSISRSELGDDFPIICGINAESVRQADDQVAEAADGGADAALVVTPTTLVRNRTAGVERFYTTVADRSPVPILLYTVPVVTGYEIPVETVLSLAEHPSIIGIKDSGGDVDRIETMATKTGPGFFVFCGASRSVRAATMRGAYGAITASANYASPLVAAAIDGDAEAQQELSSITADVEQDGVAGTKAAAAGSGLIAGRSRLPLIPI